MLTGADIIGEIDKRESPKDAETGEALFSSFSSSDTSKSSRLRSSNAFSTTDSTVSAAG